MVKNVLHQGSVEMDILKGYSPIKIEYKGIGEDIIQVDITGTGLLNYQGKLDRELQIEIYTNILESLKQYSDVAQHDSADIGHHLNLIPTRKYNRKHNAYEYLLDACIIFRNPFIDARAKVLDSAIMILSSIILEEVFIQDNCH